MTDHGVEVRKRIWISLFEIRKCRFAYRCYGYRLCRFMKLDSNDQGRAMGIAIYNSRKSIIENVMRSSMLPNLF